MIKPSLSRLRRGVLLLAGLVAVAAALAACGSSSSSSSSSTVSAGGSSDASSVSSSTAVQRADAVLAKSASAPIVWHGPTSAPPFEKNKTIALVNTTADAPDESSVRSWKALVAATKAVGWHAVEISKTDLNDALIEAVQQHVSGIFTYGADQTTLEGLNAAKKAGVPVIAAYTAITPQADKLFTHIVNQHYPEQGADSAAAVVALTKDNAKIGIFTVPPDPSNPSSLDVTLDSFKTALAGYGSGAKIVGTTSFNLSDLATPSLLAQRAVAFLQSHPTVNVIWTPFAQPAEDIDEPIIAAGLASRVKLFTFEGSSLNLDYIRKGQLVVSDVAAPLEWMSYAIVDDFNRIFDHKPVPSDEGLPIKVLTRSNLPPAGQSWTGEINYVQYYDKAWGLSAK